MAELNLYISKYSMLLGAFDVYKLIVLLESLYDLSLIIINFKTELQLFEAYFELFNIYVYIEIKYLINYT